MRIAAVNETPPAAPATAQESEIAVLASLDLVERNGNRRPSFENGTQRLLEDVPHRQGVPMQHMAGVYGSIGANADDAASYPTPSRTAKTDDPGSRRQSRILDENVVGLVHR